MAPKLIESDRGNERPVCNRLAHARKIGERSQARRADRLGVRLFRRCISALATIALLACNPGPTATNDAANDAANNPANDAAQGSDASSRDAGCGTHCDAACVGSGCADAQTPPDPCTGVTCSGHGTCVAQAGAATCTCASDYQASGASCIPTAAVYGLTIPTTHPRLLFNSQNLSSAQAWYSAHPFTPESYDPIGLALRGLLASDAAYCANAVSWALSDIGNIPNSAADEPVCETCEFDGEAIILTYDWCYGMMSESDRNTLETSVDTWVDNWRTQPLGGVPMHESDIYWAYLRNEIEWGIARYDTNPMLATTELSDAFDTRLMNDFYPAHGVVGGVGQEGAEYGPLLLGHATVPLVTAALLGRDMMDENPYYVAGVYAYIYETTPDNTALFTWNDNDLNSPTTSSEAPILDYMTAAANAWPSAPIGTHARRWLTNVGTPPDTDLQAIDTGLPAAGDLSTLPLDYYAAGPSYLFGRSAWSTTSTAFMLMLGAEDGVGTSHVDYGSFQIARGGTWLSRETVGFSDPMDEYPCASVVGLGGSGSADRGSAVAHNVAAAGTVLPSANGAPSVQRLESQPDYSFASVDLSSVYATGHIERDFVFVRSLETLVVHDRGTNVFIAHCETAPTTSGNQAICTNGAQKLVVTSLLGNPTFRIVNEGDNSGQRRVEITTSGAEMVTVLQALDSTGTAFTPTLVDNGSSHSITLANGVTLDLTQGATSTGGSITVGGTTHSLRADVQSMTVGTSGPVWH